MGGYTVQLVQGDSGRLQQVQRGYNEFSERLKRVKGIQLVRPCMN